MLEPNWMLDLYSSNIVDSVLPGHGPFHNQIKWIVYIFPVFPLRSVQLTAV